MPLDGVKNIVLVSRDLFPRSLIDNSTTIYDTAYFQIYNTLTYQCL
jgi:hypothetical protein